MGSTFGNALRVTVFGQSHSPAIGCTVEGLPAGFAVDMAALQKFMSRRAPGQGPYSTPRKEADVPRIVSGLNVQGETCGAPLTAVIENTNTKSGDYANVMAVPRPGHADYTAQVKWGGHQDVPGGGHFSGRLTAPLCVAGGIARQMLEARGMKVAAHILRVGDVADEPLYWEDNAEDAALLARQISKLEEGANCEGGHLFPTIDAESGLAMQRLIEDARQAQDSVGGIVECVVTGVEAGLGSPMFDGVENQLARALFGIPAVKGVEFGSGFDVAGMRGSANNDEYKVGADGDIVPVTNHAGGALGGISTGAPLVVKCAFKPTPSISQPQRSVNMQTGREEFLEVHGRHDPCVVPRAVPVVEAVCACVVLDMMIQEHGSTFFSPTWRD